MLEIDEISLKAITSAIDETIKLIDEKKDIRLVTSFMGNVSNKIRATSEIRETPENGFVSLVFSVLSTSISENLKAKDEEWFELNKELCNQCSDQIRNFLRGMKSSFESKSFEEATNVLKTFAFTLTQIINRMSD